MLPNTFQIQVEKMCIKLHCFLVLQFQQFCLITCYNELFIISDVSNSPHDPGVSFYREAVDICWQFDAALIFSRVFKDAQNDKSSGRAEWKHWKTCH